VSATIIDASVAAKWFLPAKQEPLVSEALVLLNGHASGNVQFVVPDLFWAELGNILWKACRQGRYTRDLAQIAIASLKQQNLPTVSSALLLDLAFKIATAFDRTVYDSLYVALAVESKAQLITADERLANGLAAHFPVKWLGAI
jgi:predicted nucleic acid-binding protein